MTLRILAQKWHQGAEKGPTTLLRKFERALSKTNEALSDQGWMCLASPLANAIFYNVDRNHPNQRPDGKDTFKGICTHYTVQVNDMVYQSRTGQHEQ